MGFGERSQESQALTGLAIGVASLLLFASAACDDRPSAPREPKSARQRTEALRDRVRSLARENRQTLEAHRPDAGLDLGTASSPDRGKESR